MSTRSLTPLPASWAGRERRWRSQDGRASRRSPLSARARDRRCALRPFVVFLPPTTPSIMNVVPPLTLVEPGSHAWRPGSAAGLRNPDGAVGASAMPTPPAARGVTRTGSGHTHWLAPSSENAREEGGRLSCHERLVAARASRVRGDLFQRPRPSTNIYIYMYTYAYYMHMHMCV